MNKKTRNPKLFREMSEPFESRDAMDAALEAFLAEMMALREKHKIPTVYTIIHASCVDDGGEEGAYIVPHMCGDMQLGEMLTAYALGHEQEERRQIIARCLKGKGS